jgi:hypothetical protein
MVEQAEQRKLSRQQKRKSSRDFKKNANQSVIISKTLWQLIKNNGGAISVPCGDLKEIPDTAAIRTKYDPETDSIIIQAGMAKEQPLKEVSNLVLPNKEIVHVTRNQQ